MNVHQLFVFTPFISIAAPLTEIFIPLQQNIYLAKGLNVLFKL
jgi:hypothetical protein